MRDNDSNRLLQELFKSCREGIMKKSISIVVILILLCAFSSGAADPKQIAVLPFAANSSENIEYIRDGVMDMLNSRLSVDGRIEVLNKSTVMDLTGKIKKKTFTQADAYVLGKRLKVDYVVLGSITKIGNSMSVDCKLVDIEANKSPVGVFVQSQGMDEVIPKISDFAKRIDMHILGQVPATFEPTPSPAALPPVAAEQKAQQDAAATPLQEPLAAETLRTKKGTLTAAINPDFIHVPQALPRKGFWMSEKIDTQIIGMDIGDVDKDGKNEIVAIDARALMIYKKQGKALKLIHKLPGKSYQQYLSVDVADINGSDTPQIFVSSINQGVLESFVLEYRNGKFVRIASDVRWLLRVIYLSGKPVLVGQTIGSSSASGLGGEGSNDPFSTPIVELGWRNGKYAEVKKLKIPAGLSIYDFLIEPLDKEGPEKIVAMDKLDYIRVMEESDKSLESLMRFFGAKEMLWKSDEQFGGSSNSFETLQRVMSKSEAKPPLQWINIRMLAYDLYKQGKKDLIVARNKSAVGRMLQDVKMFTSSEIVDLEWTGLGFSEVWKTKKINGYIADMQIKDLDNDGQNDLVLALSISSGAALSQQSVIVSYSLDIKKPEPEGLTTP